MLRSVVALTAVLLLVPAKSEAGFVFSVANGTTDVVLGQNKTVTIQVAWDNVGTNNLASPGIGTLRLALRSDNASSGSAGVTSTADLTLDPAFNNGGFITALGVTNMPGYTTIGFGTGGTARFGINATDTTSAVTTTGTTPIVLGTYTLTGTAVGTVNMRLGYDLYSGSNWATPNGIRFNDFSGANLTNQLSFLDFSFNVLNVPEPGTVTLFALGVCGMGMCEWRRRRRVTTEAAKPTLSSAN